jgi:NCAIR mutase (PurE)-related protein
MPALIDCPYCRKARVPHEAGGLLTCSACGAIVPRGLQNAPLSGLAHRAKSGDDPPAALASGRAVREADDPGWLGKVFSRRAGTSPGPVASRRTKTKASSTPKRSFIVGAPAGQPLGGATGQGVERAQEPSVRTATRQRLPEIVCAEGRSAEAILDRIKAADSEGVPVLVTRVRESQVKRILAAIPKARYNSEAAILSTSRDEAHAIFGRVAIVAADAVDRRIVAEAVETARWMRCEFDEVVMGPVASDQELPAHLNNADAVVVLSGMDVRFPGFIASRVECPVVAVPSSTGFGASFGGLAALLGMLIGGPPHMTVSNIDAGAQGAYAACLMARRAAAQARGAHSTPD